jgi:hypothetical protein
MKTWLGLPLTILAFLVGCAPGYHNPRPAYPEETSTYQDTGMLHQNPETDSERDMRIWSEESRR